jgi:hypothetical protein
MLYSPHPASLKQFSPVSFKNKLPTPPPPHASSPPKQYPSSSPKRHHTPAPTPASELPIVTESPLETSFPSEAAMSNLIRFALADPEAVADDDAIEELIQLFDCYMISIIDKSDCTSELSIL